MRNNAKRIRGEVAVTGEVRPIGWCRTVRYGSLGLTRSESMLATNFTFVVNLLHLSYARSRANNSLYSVHRSIEGCLQLIENTGLRVHRILCIAAVHQRHRGKMRFSLGSEISSRKPLCDGLSMNALDFGAHHSGDAQPPDPARADCVSGEAVHKLGIIPSFSCHRRDAALIVPE
jgi:hypothetical protein